jgi:hypothetical protein
MQVKPIIRIYFSVLLFIVFILHSGVELSVHNYFHTQKQSAYNYPGTPAIKLACSCFSDFRLPFTEIDIQEIKAPDFVYQAQSSFYLPEVLIQSTHGVSLRGPPTFKNQI